MVKDNITDESLVHLSYRMVINAAEAVGVFSLDRMEETPYSVRYKLSSLDVLRVIFVMASDIDNTIPGALIADTPFDARIHKVVFWRCIQELLRRRYSSDEKVKLRLSACDAIAHEKLVPIVEPGRKYYDLCDVHRLIQAILNGVNSPIDPAIPPTEKYVVASQYTPSFWQPGAKVDLRQMRKHVAVIFPHSDFQRGFWYKIFGPSAGLELGLQDLLRVVDIVATSDQLKMKRFWFEVVPETIDQLRAIDDSQRLPPAQAS